MEYVLVVCIVPCHRFTISYLALQLFYKRDIRLPVLWLAGLRLFEDAERLVMETSEKKNLQACIARAYEQLIYEAEEQRALITLLHQTIRLMVQYYCL